MGDEREYCRSCRTYSAPGPRCGNCFRSRVDGIGDATDEAVARSLSEARRVHTTSRLRAGTTTFGPVGRIVLSLVPALAIGVTVWLLYRFRNSGPSVAFFLVAAIATTVTMAGFLRLVWRRERID